MCDIHKDKRLKSHHIDINESYEWESPTNMKEKEIRPLTAHKIYQTMHNITS